MPSKPTSTKAPDTQQEAVKRPSGRPTIGERPMTPAERQREHRKRQREAEIQAYGKPKGQPTPAILVAIGRLLTQLDDPKQAASHTTLRHMAEQAMRELCERYSLKPIK